MKTIVFHSLNGTSDILDLKEYARALVRKGHSVLLFDFEYLSPFLYKRLEEDSGAGYVDYLKTFDIQTRLSEPTTAQKDFLRGLITPLTNQEGVKLLRIGDDNVRDYWLFTTSHRFHQQFNPLNIQAFKNDKTLIESVSKVDYLIFDVKNYSEIVEIPFLHWSDVIIHFVYPSIDCMDFACRSLVTLIKHSGIDKIKPFVCVIYDISEKTLPENYDLLAYWKNFLLNNDKLDYVDYLKESQIFRLCRGDDFVSKMFN